MKRFEVEVTETVTYRHTYTVEAESIADVDGASEDIESTADNRDEVNAHFEANNIKIIEFEEDASGESTFEVENIMED